MLFTLALSLAAAGIAAAQDTTDGGLLAYTTSVGPCTTSSIPEDQIIFSIQTDTVVETPGPQSACTYVVNADNPTQIISTISGSGIPTITSASENLILLTGSSTAMNQTTIPLITSASESLVLLTGSSSAASPSRPIATASSSEESQSTSTMTMTEGGTQSTPSDTAAATTASDGAAAASGVAGVWFGAAGAAALLAGLL